MATVKLNKVGVVVEGDQGERKKLWEEYIANYKVKNPVKYEMKRATSYVDPITGETKPKRDEFAEIAPNFRGVVRELKTAKGVIREIS